MLAAYPLSLAELRRSPFWRRAATLAVVFVLHALLLFLLLRLAPAPPVRSESPSGPITIELLPESPTPAKRPKSAAKAARARAKPAPRPPSSPVDRTRSPDGAGIWSQVIPLSSKDFAASDIAAMPSHRTGDAGQGEAEGPEGGADAGGGGGGPNGERLFNADWARKPSSAELSGYLPAGAPRTGWGMIACRTVEGNRVEDCHEIGESPPGSRFASAVRQAAWQFRVLPPRVGGRKLVGAWVRIRIEYSESVARP